VQSTTNHESKEEEEEEEEKKVEAKIVDVQVRSPRSNECWTGKEARHQQ
jgi:hypothetical protein